MEYENIYKGWITTVSLPIVNLKDMETKKLKLSEVEDLCVEGVNTRDYPDFCDAFFSSGWHIAENRELTEEELIQLSEDYPEELNEMAYQSLI